MEATYVGIIQGFHRWLGHAVLELLVWLRGEWGGGEGGTEGGWKSNTWFYLVRLVNCPNINHPK